MKRLLCHRPRGVSRRNRPASPIPHPGPIVRGRLVVGASRAWRRRIAGDCTALYGGRRSRGPLLTRTSSGQAGGRTGRPGRPSSRRCSTGASARASAAPARTSGAAVGPVAGYSTDSLIAAPVAAAGVYEPALLAVVGDELLPQAPMATLQIASSPANNGRLRERDIRLSSLVGLLRLAH